VASPIIYAHRGASFELPENTLEAFELALDLGADAIETDAHMTRDGRIVLAHDPRGARTAGVDRAIADLTLDEVRLWDVGARFSPRRPGAFRVGTPCRLPLLEEALSAFPGVVFNVDAKQTSPDMTGALVRCIRSCGAEERVRIASFSTANLRRVRARGYRGETGLSLRELAPILLAPRKALRWLSPPGNAAQMPPRAYGYTFASQEAIDRLHAVGLRVDFWSVDDPDLRDRLFALGADGVMTDDPRALCNAGSTGRRGRAARDSARSGKRADAPRS
jgi:glycerophosphoryl diester phosphodiesterase